MRGGSTSGKKPIKEVQELRARIAKLERVNRGITKPGNADEELDKAWYEWERTFDATKDSITFIDSEFRIVQANLATSRFLGKPLDEIIGKTCWQIVYGTDQPPNECPLKKARYTKKHEEMELYIPEKDIWIEALVDPVLDAEGNLSGAVHIIKDITERKEAEEALQRQGKELQTILDSVPALIFYKDKENRFIRVNKACAEFLGKSKEELEGKSLFEIFPRDQAEAFVRDNKEVMTSGHPKRNIIEPVETPKGIKWVQADKIPYKNKKRDIIGIIGFAIDITERKRAKEMLFETKNYLSSLLEYASAPIIVWDTEQRITIFNRAFEQLTGYRRAETLGRSLSMLFAEESRDDSLAKIGQTLRGEYWQSMEIPILCKDGGIRLVLWNSANIYGKDGQTLIATIAQGQDITERKKAEEQIARLAKFPAENPNPVLRISAFGTVIYGNKASLPLLKAWRCSIGGSLPDRWCRFALDALSSGQSEQTEIQCDGRTFSLIFAPIMDVNYVNIYGLDITERKRTEQKLIDYQSRLKSLASQLTLAEERERRRIAVELHDQIGQSLAISKVKLEALRKFVSNKELERELNETCDTLSQMIADTRTLTFDLSSPILYELDFERAVAEWLTERIEKKHGIQTEFEDDGQPKLLDDDIRMLLFRDVRELLINVVKHAQAKKIRVCIRKVGSRIRVSVEDDGVGFDPAEAASKAAKDGRFGLFSIRERLEQIGGHLEIKSKPGRGCKVTMTAPLRKGKVNNARE